MAELKAIEYDRSLEFEQQERVILRIVEHCGLKRRPFVDVNSKPDRDAEILILTHTGDYEAQAASMTLGKGFESVLRKKSRRMRCQTVVPSID